MGKATVSNTQEKNSIDTWISNTDNIKSNLLNLKEEIQSGLKENKDNELKSKVMVDKDLETDFEKQFSLFEKDMDDLAEQRFDKFAQTNRSRIQDIINTSNEEKRKEKLTALSTEFSDILFGETDAYFDNIKNLATTPFTIEINDLYTQVNHGILQASINGGLDNPYGAYPEEGVDNASNTGQGSKEVEKSYIDPTTLVSTDIGAYTYVDFDTNANGKISKKELKKNDIVNRYRNNKNDKNKAVIGILDIINEEDFNKSDIKSINRDDLVNILDTILSPEFLSGVTDENGTLKKKDFKKKFKEEFIKKDLYDKQGFIFNRNEVEKIANIIDNALESKTDNQTFWNNLQRLADAGDTAKNIDYTGMWNAEAIINKVSPDNIFLFLCDFDGDGKVNSTPVGKDKKTSSRRDTASVMGGQLYANFLLYADTKFETEDKEKFDNGKLDKYIVDGEKTSRVIQNILEAVKNFSENPKMKKAIDQFITDKTTTNGFITMEDFHSFMQNGYDYTDTEGTIVHVDGLSDIKEFLMSIANQLNEKKDISRLFMDKTDIQQQILESAAVMTDMEHIDIDHNNPRVKKREEGYTSQLEAFISKEGLQEYVSNEELANARNTGIMNTIKVINLVTDLIYLDLGETAENIIGGIFSGATIAGIKYTFNQKDKTLNGRRVKDVLGDFIAESLQYSVGLGFVSYKTTEQGENPNDITTNKHKEFVLGGSINFSKMNPDLSNRFGSHFSANFNPFQLKFNFNFGVEGARQVNKSKTKELHIKKPIPANRIGIEAGAGVKFSWKFRKDLGVTVPYIGAFFERDFPAGIEQKARHYDSMIKKVLNFENIVTYDSYDKFLAGMETNLTKLTNGPDADKDIIENKNFLTDMYTLIGNEMQRAGVFELVKSLTGSEELKKNIFKYMYTASIDAFHENAIEQQGYEQLTGKLKITKLGIKDNLLHILALAGLGATLGSVVPGRGTVIGGVTGAVTGMITFSTWKSYYMEDIVGKGYENYMNIQRGSTAQEHQEILDEKDITKLASFMESQLNPTQKLVNVVGDATENELVITGAEELAPTEYLNIYYSDKAQANGAFKYENGELRIGNTGLRVAHNIKGNKVETFLFIGEEMGGEMTKLSGKANINEDKTIEGFTETPYYAEFDDKSQIKIFVEADPQLQDKSTIILGFFENDGSFKKNLDTIPTTLQGKKVSVGTITITEIDGKASVTSYDNTTQSNKLTIKYITKEKITGTPITIDNLKYEEVVSLNDTKLFAPDIKFSVFTSNVEKTLSVFENAYINSLYKEFMLPVLNDALDGFIDEQNYENAFIKLKDILEKNTNYNTAVSGTELGNLKILINNSSLTRYDKAFIVDKFKAIFSYDKQYTSGYQVPWIRTDYMKLMGPDNKTPYPLTAEYKNKLKGNIGSSRSLRREPVENLVGFTSFYRLNESTGRKFSMTALGGTNVLSNGNLQQSMIPIESDKLPQTKERFVGNMNKTPENKEIIVQKLNNKLINYHITLTPDNLDELFNGEYITIDNGKKNVKVDITYYFYLLGECSNESIGATIDQITIYNEITGEYTEDFIEGSIDGNKKTRRGVSLKTGTHNVEYDINPVQQDLTLKIRFDKKRKPGNPEITTGENQEPGGVIPETGGTQDPGNGSTGEEGQ